MFHIFDALEQFDIFSSLSFICCLTILPTNLNITHIFTISCLFLLLLTILSESLCGPFWFNRNEVYFFENSLIFVVFKSLFILVTDILKDNILQKKNSNIGFIFFLFLTLLFSNVAGLFPFTFTVTSSFVVTLFFSLTVFLAANIMGIYRNGFYILSNFLPTGTPLFISPLLILIEIISYFSRIFSLSIRLFANMLSGHGLLKILIGFSFVSFQTLKFWFILGLLP